MKTDRKSVRAIQQHLLEAQGAQTIDAAKGIYLKEDVQSLYDSWNKFTIEPTDIKLERFNQALLVCQTNGRQFPFTALFTLINQLKGPNLQADHGSTTKNKLI